SQRDRAIEFLGQRPASETGTTVDDHCAAAADTCPAHEVEMQRRILLLAQLGKRDKQRHPVRFLEVVCLHPRRTARLLRVVAKNADLQPPRWSARCSPAARSGPWTCFATRGTRTAVRKRYRLSVCHDRRRPVVRPGARWPRAVVREACARTASTSAAWRSDRRRSTACGARRRTLRVAGCRDGRCNPLRRTRATRVVVPSP